MSFRSDASKKLFALMLTLLMVGMVLLVWAPSSEAQSAQGGLQLVQSDTNRIILELTAESFSSQLRTINGTRYAMPSISGLEVTNENGKPQLPMKSTLVAIPPGAQASLKVLVDDSQNSTLSAAPIPVPTFLGPSDPTQTLTQSSAQVIKPDAVTYAANQLYPHDVARINSDSSWRSQRVLSIVFYPLQVNPVTRQVVLHQRLRIEITLTYPRGATAQSMGGSVNEGAFEQVFRQSILNYSSSRNWRMVTPSASSRLPSGPPTGVGPLYRVSLDHDGMYQITCAQMATAGITMPVNLNYVRMFKQGTELAIYTNGTCPNSSGTGYIEFFGEAVDTKYTTINVYWLTPGNGSMLGKRMVAVDASIKGGETLATVFTDTIRVEQNRLYRPGVPIGIEDADHWYGDYLGSAYGAKSFPFQLDRLASVGATAIVKSRSTSFNGSAFTFDTSINGTPAATTVCPMSLPCEVVVPFTRTLLASGANTLTVNASQIIFFNNFDLEYPATFTAVTDTLRFQIGVGTWRYSISNFSNTNLEAFDVTDPSSVTRFTNLTTTPTLQFAPGTISSTHQYFTLASSQRQTPLSITSYTSANLSSPSNGADYIAIAYNEFMTETKRLTDFRATQGMRVKLVDVQNVYDEYNDGVFDPIAIRNFLSDTVHWSGARPQFVLLVGDGHWDPHGYCINVSNCPGSLATPPNSNFIPAFLRMVDPFMGETATDNQFVAFGSNHLPSLSIGRLPANSVADVTAMVNKILQNDQNPPAGTWRSTISFVSGDSYWHDGTWDNGGDGNLNGFWGYSDAIISQNPQFVSDRIYYNGCDPNFHSQCALPYSTYSTTAGVQAATVAAINAGRIIVNYIGHGTQVGWTSNDVGYNWPWFFGGDPSTQDDVSGLTNGVRAPLMLEMTCFTGQFQIPYLSSLAEVNVRRSGNGALASWAASGLGLAIGHDRLNVGFFDAVTKNGVRQIGLATDAGKALATSYVDLLDTFILFGDPASRLQIQMPIYLPLILR
ncbi:MAG: hypothetical protein HZB51_26750 [Chloroflexi bacterium]|nr:hypothetical protein [Chloroflexota bacterium]